MNNFRDLIEKLEIKEKAKLLCGAGNMISYPVPSLNIPSIDFSDGPNGLRIENDGEDKLIHPLLPVTCFPCGTSMAMTWNKDLIKQVGNALGEECLYFGKDILLGPAINIKRNPLCGRNFEYYSEDPYLAGWIGANFINGIQEKGVGACVKHFACNNTEDIRNTGNSIVSERALKEIYLKNFEIAVKNANPAAIMSSYNKINGTYASENGYLLNKVLRKDWKYNGLCITDWGGNKSRERSLAAGTDLEMPGCVKHSVELIGKGLGQKIITEEQVDQSIDRILNVALNKKPISKTCDFAAHHNLAIETAKEAAVLLKNDGILPLSKSESYFVVGDLFTNLHYQGGGSSQLEPKTLNKNDEALNKRKINYNFLQGYNIFESKRNKKLEKQTINDLIYDDTIIYYCGFSDFDESEGFDKENMSLPANQLSLLNKLIDMGKKIVVVLFTGSPVELPFLDKVNAVLYMGLCGEGIGEATTSLLFGETVPSGRLDETWPIKYDDVPFSSFYRKKSNEIYKEDIFVGYRYYETANKEVRFPFGYGLSYINFTYSNLRVSYGKAGIKVSVTVKNESKKKGSEVVQIYLHKEESNTYRPIRELKAFDKVCLNGGEKITLHFLIKPEDIEIYSNFMKKKIVERGYYYVQVCKNSHEVILEKHVEVLGEKIDEYPDIEKCYYGNLNTLESMSNSDYEKIFTVKIPNEPVWKRPYTMETPIYEMKSLVGKSFNNTFYKMSKKIIREAKKIDDPTARSTKLKNAIYFRKAITKNSLNVLTYSSSNQFPYNKALAMLEMVNGHILKGLLKMKKAKD